MMRSGRRAPPIASGISPRSAGTSTRRNGRRGILPGPYSQPRLLGSSRGRSFSTGSAGEPRSDGADHRMPGRLGRARRTRVRRPTGPSLWGIDRMSAVRDDLAEQAVRFAVGAGGEEQFVGLRRVPVAEPQTPQAVDDDRLAIGLPQLTAASAVVRVVDVDVTVAEVSNEQITAELAVVRRREGEPPWRVELAAGHQAAS